MLIVKVGGGAQIQFDAIAEDLATLEQPIVVVHGANALRNQLAEQMQIPIQEITSLSGYTSVYSDPKLLDLMLMSYAGLANKKLVVALQQQGLRAVGLTGLDGGLIRGKRNPGIRTMRNGKKMIVRDLSGKPKSANTSLLHQLLDSGYIPVVTVPILDEHGEAINAENDEIVAILQAELNADRVVQLIEAPGLLADREDPQSLIPQLSRNALSEWEQNTQGRMRRKLLAIGKLFKHPGTFVHISDGRVPQPITRALQGAGTVIQ